MKFIPVGIYEKDSRLPLYAKASDLSDEHYDGIQMRKSRDGHPVIVMRSKKSAPLPWKVAYGFSEIYFRSFEEAINFCNSRGMQLVKEQLK